MSTCALPAYTTASLFRLDGTWKDVTLAPEPQWFGAANNPMPPGAPEVIHKIEEAPLYPSYMPTSSISHRDSTSPSQNTNSEQVSTSAISDRHPALVSLDDESNDDEEDNSVVTHEAEISVIATDPGTTLDGYHGTRGGSAGSNRPPARAPEGDHMIPVLGCVRATSDAVA